MNKKMTQGNEQDRIEELAKELFNYDEESLLKEFLSAQEEAERYMTGNPDMYQDINIKFEALADRLKAENIQPIFKADMSEEQKSPVRNSIRLKKTFRPLLAAAMLTLCLLGGSLLTFGRRSHNFWHRSIAGNQSRIVWNNIEDVFIYDDLETAYAEIEESLGINAMRLNYTPDNMEFQEFVIDKGQAVLKYQYKDNLVYFEQMKYEYGTTSAVNKDQIVYNVVYNRLLDRNIAMGRNELMDNRIEYRGDLIIRDARYNIFGVMEEEEMIMILENWSFVSN